MAIFQKGLLDVVTLALLWGPSFFFMKIAISDITPLTLIALRVGLAGTMLYVFLRLKSIKVSLEPSLFAHAAVVGFFANGLPFVCFCYSLFYIPTSLSALINGLTPILTILLASLLFEQEKLTRNRVFGVLLGLSGFLILVLPSIFGTQLSFDIRGVLCGLVGACSYAIGMVYAKKHVQGRCNPMIVLPSQLLSAFVLIGLLAVIFESPGDLVEIRSWQTWAAVGLLALFSTALAFLLYYRIMVRQGVATLSMVGYLLPVVATVLGILFLEEEIGFSFFLSTLLILMGVVLVNRRLPEPAPVETEELPEEVEIPS